MKRPNRAARCASLLAALALPLSAAAQPRGGGPRRPGPKPVKPGAEKPAIAPGGQRPGQLVGAEETGGLPFEVRLFNTGQSLRVGPDGSVHMVVDQQTSGAATGGGGLSQFISVSSSSEGSSGASAPKGINGPTYLRKARGGRFLSEPVPGPGGKWKDGDYVTEALLDLDAQGQPIIAMEGQYCYDAGDKRECDDRLWVARRQGKGWKTIALKVPAGSYSEIALAAGGPSGDWTVAARYAEDKDENPWKGVVRYDGGERPERWIEGAAPNAMRLVIEDGGRPALLYRRGQKLYVHRGGQTSQLAGGTWMEIAGAPSPGGGVQYLTYRPGPDAMYYGDTGGELRRIDTAESGWYNDLAVGPDGRPVAAWYYWRNPFNKGVMLGAQGPDGEWETWTQLRSEDINVGWFTSVDVGADGTVALLSLNRSERFAVLKTYDSLEVAKLAAAPAAGDWTDRSRWLALFVYGGGWYNYTTLATSPPSDEDFTYAREDMGPLTGSYSLQPSPAIEGGFAGKIGSVDLAVEYMQRNSEDEAFQTIEKMQNLAGKLGIDNIPIPGSETQIHLRNQVISGTYTDAEGLREPFESSDRIVDVRYVDKRAFHLGFRYHSYSGPQDVYLSKDHVVLDAFVADAEFTEGSILGGYSVMNYLKKYEVQHFGPYLDAQGGIGFVDVDLNRRDDSTPLTEETWAASYDEAAAAFWGEADLGLVAYKRWRGARGAGAFARLGARGTIKYIGAGEPDEEDKDEDDADTLWWPNFARLDARYGPYVNAGVVF